MLCNYAEAIGLGGHGQAMDEDITPSYPKCSLDSQGSETKSTSARQPRLFNQYEEAIRGSRLCDEQVFAILVTPQSR